MQPALMPELEPLPRWYSVVLLDPTAKDREIRVALWAVNRDRAYLRGMKLGRVLRIETLVTGVNATRLEPGARL